MKKKTEEIGNGLPLTRRGWLGALAGLGAVLSSVRRQRTRPPAAAEQHRRRRLWIGHT